MKAANKNGQGNSHFLFPILIWAVILFVPACSDSEQAFGIGTSGQGSATYSMGSAIAKVALEKTELQIVVQPVGGTGKVLPLVNEGMVDFGVASLVELNDAILGRGPFEGRPNRNLRMIARLYPFRVGFFVRQDSTINSIKDIEGRRISSTYSGQKIVDTLTRALLANAGLTYDDMQTVPTTTIVGNADDFIAGKTDIGFFALGAAKVSQVHATVGGIRFISLDDSPSAIARMQDIFAQSGIVVVEPDPNLAGVTGPTKVAFYDYLMYAGAHVPDRVAAEITGVLLNNKPALIESFGLFKQMETAELPKDVGLTYHNGARDYYRRAGLWNRPQ